MSQTPVDGPDEEGRSLREPDRGTESASLFSRVASRIRGIGRSLRDRLRSATEATSTGHEFDQLPTTERESATGQSRSVQCVGPTEGVVDGNGRAVTDDLVETQTAKAGDREGPTDDRPELAVEREDGELTLRSPDDPDAHITSTHWQDVER